MFRYLLDHHQVHKELKYVMCNVAYFSFVDLMMVE